MNIRPYQEPDVDTVTSMNKRLTSQPVKTSIAILGEFNSTRPSRVSIGSALEHSAASLGIELEYFWVNPDPSGSSISANCNAVFIGPGEASEDTTGILKVIETARLKQIPCLGTCGGFQRVIAEYALNVLDFDKLEHEEISPDVSDPFFSHLNCSLVGQDAEVHISPDSFAAQIYGANRITESFFCKYGINSKYLDRLQSADFKVSAYDSSGEARIVELPGHRFFMATLFVPQVRSTEDHPHPIITAFLEAACRKVQFIQLPFYEAP